MKLLCAATVALMLATSATATSSTTDQETKIKNFLAAYVSTSCATSSSWRSVMTFADGLAYDQYLMCQPPCKDDLQNLTSSIPDCANDAGTFAKVAKLSQICTNMTRPTTNGGACTTADSALLNGLMSSAPVWLNCSTKRTNLYDLRAYTTEEAKTLCGSATCMAYINSVRKSIPSCFDSHLNETMDYFQSVVGCTPAAIGAYCSMVDLAVKNDAGEASLWSNCSTSLKMTTFGTLESMFEKLAKRPEDMPSGFCASTCPANYLSIKKTLPSCSSYGMMLTDPSPLYIFCPNLKPRRRPLQRPRQL